MLSRRSLLRAGAGVALVSQFGGFDAQAQAQTGPLFSFGVVADPQYAPVAPRRTRYYANSLWKLAEAIEEFNGQKLAFVTTLGDIIDRHWESYAHILPVYDRLKHPHFFVLGNHDYEVGADYLHAVTRQVGLKRAWYDFPAGPGWRVLVIDGNDVSLFANPAGSDHQKLARVELDRLSAAKAPNAQIWNGGMSEAQWTFVRQRLDDARARNEKVIILGHYPVWPVNEHNMWGYERFVELVTSYPNVVAFFSGHNHAGNYGVEKGKHFVNFRGMVETPDKTAFNVVSVYPDRLDVRGYGLEESRRLTLA